MRVALRFEGNGMANVELQAETEAEKAILAFMAEGRQQWNASRSYTYRPSEIDRIELVRVKDGMG